MVVDSGVIARVERFERRLEFRLGNDGNERVYGVEVPPNEFVGSVLGRDIIRVDLIFVAPQ